MVTGIWLLDTAHQITLTHSIYTYLVTFYGDLVEVNVVNASGLAEFVITAFTIFLVQLFFIMRAWRMSGNNFVVTVLLLLCSVVTLATLLAFTFELSRQPTFQRLVQLKNLANSAGISAAICDVAIAVVLIYYLYSSRKGFSRSDSIIKKLILFSLTTGLLTSLCAVCSMIALAVAPSKLTYALFFVNITKLYCNSLLAALNVRDAIRDRTVVPTEGTSLGYHAFLDHAEHDSRLDGLSQASIFIRSTHRQFR